jgi:ATP-dependent Clp protease ATP-binding subunit ClpA
MNELINAAPGILPPRAQAALRRASEKAKAAGQPAVQPQHILLGILAGPGVAADALASLGVPADTLAAEVESTLPAGGRQPVEGEVPVSEATRLLFQRALTESQRLMHNYIGTEHLLLALSADDTVGKALAARGASGDQLRAAVQAEFKKLGLDKRVPGPA